MRVVVLQSNYIPWKGYFELIKDADIFCFYDEVKYTKNDWRNRNKLSGKNGEFWLTIPINKDAVKQKISEVKIIDVEWQEKHYKTILQTYIKAPQIESLKPILEDIFLKKPWDSLSGFNQYIIKTFSEYAGIKTKFVNSADYNLEGDRVNRLIKLIKQLGGTHYISGPAAKDYLKGSEMLFQNDNIKLDFKSYGPYLKYSQNGTVFNDYVSIIDLFMFIPQEKITHYLTSAHDSI